MLPQLLLYCKLRPSAKNSISIKIKHDFRLYFETAIYISFKLDYGWLILLWIMEGDLDALVLTGRILQKSLTLKTRILFALLTDVL